MGCGVGAGLEGAKNSLCPRPGVPEAGRGPGASLPLSPVLLPEMAGSVAPGPAWMWYLCIVAAFSRLRSQPGFVGEET